jgi:antitoxin component YwqK of YwqJK toxin-antitoxin module
MADDLQIERQYFKSGKLHLEVHKRGSVVHGPFIEYHESGGICVQFHCIDGLRHGTYTCYAEDGSVLFDSEFVRGTGVAASYVLGRISSLKRYRHGELFGEQVEFDGKGLIDRCAYFADGKRMSKIRFEGWCRENGQDPSEPMSYALRTGKESGRS